VNYWFSDIYRAIDGMQMEGFVSGLSPDVELVFANNPPLRGVEAVRQGIGGFWGSIDGLKHTLVNVIESDAHTVLELRVDYLRKDGRTVSVPCVTMLNRDAELIRSMRIHIDLTPVYA
jgi:hypothetical protein